MFRKNCNNVETKRYICFFTVIKNYVLCMPTPNQDPHTQGPQKVSYNNQQITHQIPTKCGWNELQDAYFTASKYNIALSPDKNFLARPGIVVILKNTLSEIREGKLRRRSNVELFTSQTKLSELSSWKVRHLHHHYHHSLLAFFYSKFYRIEQVVRWGDLKKPPGL